MHTSNKIGEYDVTFSDPSSYPFVNQTLSNPHINFAHLGFQRIRPNIPEETSKINWEKGEKLAWAMVSWRRAWGSRRWSSHERRGGRGGCLRERFEQRKKWLGWAPRSCDLKKRRRAEQSFWK
jgi:hypothetical protein